MKNLAHPTISMGFYVKLMEQKHSHEVRASAFHDGKLEAYMNGHIGDTQLFTKAFNNELLEIQRIDQLLQKYNQNV